jgi:hypothetical protein
MKIFFKLLFAETAKVEEIYIVGNIPELGSWNP